MGLVTIGADIGQQVDPTAIAVADAAMRVVDKRQETVYTIRHLERLPLGTDYQVVADRIAGVVAGVMKKGMVCRRLYADTTGVGRPVVDMLPPALARQGVVATPVWPVTFTYGDRRTERDDEREVVMGKAWLVSRLQVLLQTKRILLPDTVEARALADELLVYEIKVRDNGNEQFGAFKVGTHDDLVTALGLAVQDDMPPPRGPGVAFRAHPRQLSAGAVYDGRQGAHRADDPYLRQDRPFRETMYGEQPRSDEWLWGARRRPTGD